MTDSGAPGQDRRLGFVVESRSVRPPVRHPVVGGEDVSRAPVLPPVALHDVDQLLDLEGQNKVLIETNQSKSKYSILFFEKIGAS